MFALSATGWASRMAERQPEFFQAACFFLVVFYLSRHSDDFKTLIH